MCAFMEPNLELSMRNKGKPCLEEEGFSPDHDRDRCGAGGEMAGNCGISYA